MSLITPFDPWNSKLCTCPAKYSLSGYTGCSHGCLYCYASSYIVNFAKPREKKDFLNKLERELKKLTPSSFITMSNSSDPYLGLEKKLGLTRQALQILKNYDLKLMIVTKSSLVTRDLDILKEFKKVVVAISLTTLNEALAKKLEPNSCLPKERLKAIESLAAHIPVVCRFDPLIYPLNTDEVEKIIKRIKEAGAKQIITSTYKAKPDNFKKMIRAFGEHKDLWHELYLVKGQRLSGYRYMPKEKRKELIEKVRTAALSQELEFSSCREGFGKLNTAECDGSSFLYQKEKYPVTL